MAIRDTHHETERDGGPFRPRDTSSQVNAECTRIARRLLAQGHRIVGLVPADERTAVPPVAAGIASALHMLSGSAIGLVDANTLHPGSDARPPEPGDPRYATRWVSDGIALVTPAAGRSPGAAVPELARLLLDEQDDFAALLVDLTGFDRLGEHASAAACCDAVLVVARAHKSRERAVRTIAAELPPDQLLGVLLVG